MNLESDFSNVNGKRIIKHRRVGSRPTILNFSDEWRTTSEGGKMKRKPFREMRTVFKNQKRDSVSMTAMLNTYLSSKNSKSTILKSPPLALSHAKHATPPAAAASEQKPDHSTSTTTSTSTSTKTTQAILAVQDQNLSFYTVHNALNESGQETTTTYHLNGSAIVGFPPEGTSPHETHDKESVLAYLSADGFKGMPPPPHNIHTYTHTHIHTYTHASFFLHPCRVSSPCNASQSLCSIVSLLSFFPSFLSFLSFLEERRNY